jgi:hypothetical protein
MGVPEGTEKILVATDYYDSAFSWGVTGTDPGLRRSPLYLYAFLDGTMCILMLLYQKVQGYPIVLVANRDEYYDRPTRAPQLFMHAPAVWAGQDVRAGGTWLGVNAYGMVIGLTNRRMQEEQKNDPACRSRGLLCLEALQCCNPAQVLARLDSEPVNRYNPFNLLVISPDETYWVAYDGLPEKHPLEAGLHILGNGNINDVDTVRIRRARHLLEQSDTVEFHEFLPLLERACQDHERGEQERDAICMHRPKENYGTVSSTIMALTPDWQGSLYRYAAGPPCITPYQDYTLPFGALS